MKIGGSEEAGVQPINGSTASNKVYMETAYSDLQFTWAACITVLSEQETQLALLTKVSLFTWNAFT